LQTTGPETQSKQQRPEIVRIARLRPRNSGRFAHTVYQEDLEQILILKTQLRVAGKQLEAKERYVKAALRSGARVEEGIHSAKIIRWELPTRRVKGASCSRLLVS